MSFHCFHSSKHLKSSLFHPFCSTKLSKFCQKSPQKTQNTPTKTPSKHLFLHVFSPKNTCFWTFFPQKRTFLLGFFTPGLRLPAAAEPGARPGGAAGGAWEKSRESLWFWICFFFKRKNSIKLKKMEVGLLEQHQWLIWFGFEFWFESRGLLKWPFLRYYFLNLVFFSSFFVFP